MDTVYKLTTRNGKDSIGYRGFLYHFDKLYQTTGRKDWRCAKRECKGRLQTSATMTEPTEKGLHSHFPNRDEIASKMALTTMKTRCKEEPTSIPVIYKNEAIKSANQGFKFLLY